jgi:hypothetical protein
VSTATALLHLESELAPGADARAFSAWCDQHHHEVLQVSGFLRARRFEQLDHGTGAVRLLTLYDLLAASVLESEAYAAHGRTHTPLPGDLAGALSFSRSVWSAVAPGDGAAVGGGIVTERSAIGDPASLVWPSVARLTHVVAIRRFAAADPTAGPAGSLALLEVRSADDVDATVRALPAAAPGAQRAAFRQVFHAVA